MFNVLYIISYLYIYRENGCIHELLCQIFLKAYILNHDHLWAGAWGSVEHCGVRGNTASFMFPNKSESG
jgi:hypothetical protein